MQVKHSHAYIFKKCFLYSFKTKHGILIIWACDKCDCSQSNCGCAVVQGTQALLVILSYYHLKLDDTGRSYLLLCLSNMGLSPNLQGQLWEWNVIKSRHQCQTGGTSSMYVVTEFYTNKNLSYTMNARWLVWYCFLVCGGRVGVWQIWHCSQGCPYNNPPASAV